MHCFIMEIPNKRKRQQIAFNHPPDVELKDFMNLYKNIYIAKPYSVLGIDATLASDNPSSFRRNLL